MTIKLPDNATGELMKAANDTALGTDGMKKTDAAIHMDYAQVLATLALTSAVQEVARALEKGKT